MKFKPEVRIYDFTDTSVMHILEVLEITCPHGYDPTITSANDGHKFHRGRGHKENRAFDVRVKDFPGFSLWRFKSTRWVIDQWIIRMKPMLPDSEYLILFGNDKRHKNHIHLERRKI